MKYFETGCTDIYMNLAIEESLLKHADKDETIIFLWQNEKSIVIGRNQNPLYECNIEKVLQDGVNIARRKSGGGAVYHDMGNLCFSIIGSSEIRYSQFVEKLMKFFSLEAEFNGRNDLLLNGKKFSGNAIYQSGDRCCQHGTLLVNCNIGKMVSYLTPDVSKMVRNQISSVESRVINLSDIDSSITINEVKTAIKRILKPKLMSLDYQAEEIQKLLAFYKSDDWIFDGVELLN